MQSSSAADWCGSAAAAPAYVITSCQLPVGLGAVRGVLAPSVGSGSVSSIRRHCRRRRLCSSGSATIVSRRLALQAARVARVRIFLARFLVVVVVSDSTNRQTLSSSLFVCLLNAH